MLMYEDTRWLWPVGTRLWCATVLLGVSPTFLTAAGCKEDACRGRPAEIEISVQPDRNVDVAAVSFVRVRLNINGMASISRDFKTSAPTFVFEPGDDVPEPRSITVSAIAYANASTKLGSGEITKVFSTDGCNFLHIRIRGATGEPECGDGTISGTEQCDTGQLGARTCRDEGFSGGELACLACEFDPAGCRNAVDASIDGATHDAGTDEGGAGDVGPHRDGCSYPCGEQCCIGRQLCLGQTECVEPEADVTVLYATRQPHRGDLRGRSGSTGICVGDKPAELSCSVIRAFLTIASDDQLRDMPAKYGFSTTSRVYVFHQLDRHLTQLANSWVDAINGEISNFVTVEEGTGMKDFSSPHGFWTGSDANGAYELSARHDYTCGGWTCDNGLEAGCIETIGTQGDALVLVNWLHSATNYIPCSRELTLLCACKVQ